MRDFASPTVFVALVGLAQPGAAAADTPSHDRAETVARDFLSSRPDLRRGGELVLERARPSGLVRFRRHHHGVPIVGGVVVVRVDDRGRVLWASADKAEVPADLATTPALAAAEAVARASSGRSADADLARLVVWAPPGRAARLAWEVRLPFDWAEHAAWRVVLDAGDGGLLYRQNEVAAAKQGKVYAAASPAVGPLEEVTLNLPDGATRLENAEIMTRGCVDTGKCLDNGFGFFYRQCVFETLAAADANGDFLYDRPADDRDPEDAFAEVQAFYHVDRGLKRLRALGLGELVGVFGAPLQVVVNFREPRAPGVACPEDATAPLRPLLPVDNAFFAGGTSGQWAPPTIVLGQGTTVDLAYDGDVVYHELTHVAQYALYGWLMLYIDERGTNTDGGSISEGTADYFSAGTAGDSFMGNYVWMGLPYPTRDLMNDKHCPEALTGEPHADGELFSGALWEVRQALPEEQRDTFDAAVLAAMDGFGDHESFDTAREKVAAEATARLGAEAGQAVEQRFGAKGLIDCDRVIDVPLGAPHPELFAIGAFSQRAQPASFQLRISLPEDAQRLIVTLASATSRSSFVEVVPANGPVHLLLKPGHEPIRWDPGQQTHDATLDAPLVIRGSSLQTAIEGPFEKGSYVVQLANEDSFGVTLSELTFTIEPAEGGCAVGSNGTRPSGAALLALLTLLALRRRARR